MNNEYYKLANHPTGTKATIKEIADESQLSRVTVTKHLKEYYQSDTYNEKER